MTRAERDKRLAEIEVELEGVRRNLNRLVVEKGALEDANARDDWPAGPFVLHFWRHHAQDKEEYGTPLEALQAAIGMEDYGSASTEKITDREGNTIYTLDYPWKRLDDSYPDMPEEAYA